MKSPKTILEAQVSHLLDLTGDWARDRCEEISRNSVEQAGEIVCQAHRDARRHLRRHAEEDRKNAARKLMAYEATLKTAQRQERQRHDTQFLEQTWQLLCRELVDRWNQSDHREVWIGNVMRKADKALPKKQWRIDTGSGWPDEEQKRLKSLVTEVTGVEPQWFEDKRIEAGVRISVDGASVDGTLDGLVANRERLEAEMLAYYRKLCAKNMAD